MGKGEAIPFIEISCYPSTITWEQYGGKNAVQEASSNESTLVSQRGGCIAGWMSNLKVVQKAHLCELVNPELTRSASSDSMDERAQANDDVPAPLRQS